ncbi:MAG TPA: PE family protein [Mycobacterium sp.]|nr:PE family protein [Mycobacterium sp.]HUH67593.1 PE family protein [Mycobacterium sp.]
MAYVIAAPEMMTAAATDLGTIGSNVNAAHMVAAARTTSVIPAATDEVSTGIAQLFSQHAANYQALARQAAQFNAQFVQHLTAGAFSYASIEAALASLLKSSITDAGAFISYVATWTPEDWLIAIGSVLILALTVAVFATPILLIVGIAVLGHFYPAL